MVVLTKSFSSNLAHLLCQSDMTGHCHLTEMTGMLKLSKLICRLSGTLLSPSWRKKAIDQSSHQTPGALCGLSGQNSAGNPVSCFGRLYTHPSRPHATPTT